jgi:putative cardiolipin synthase
MGRALAAAERKHSGQSGVHLLAANEEALAARLAIADEARETLDVQTYLLHWDATGRVVIDRLLRAADRGVRVRVLVDDIDLVGIDHRFSAIDAHPQLEVRVFNPFHGREDPSGVSRLVHFLHDGERLNRRMHIKLFAADTRVAITGGRNIGDEYFTSRQGMHFKDLDVLVVGPVVRDAARMFDRYWNSEWAVPVAAFRTGRASRRDIAAVAGWRSRLDSETETRTLRGRTEARAWAQRLRTGRLALTWSRAQLLYDPPERVGNGAGAGGDSLLGPHLLECARRCRRELIVISSYFVPGDEGVDVLCGLVQRGVRVRVLTNSLAATDVPIVHGGYEKYRRALLRGGVELYEMKPDAKARREWRARSTASTTCLHAKAYVFDGTRMVVGSFNADPRSGDLNTEAAVAADSAEICRQVRVLFDEAVSPEASYRVVLDQRGRLAWLSAEAGRARTDRAEPRARLWRRMHAALVRLLPIEGHL